MARPTTEGSISLLGALLLTGVAIFGAGALAQLLGASIAWISDTTLAVAMHTLSQASLFLGICQLSGIALALYFGLRGIYDEPDPETHLAIKALGPKTLILALVAGFCLQFPMHQMAEILAHQLPSWALSEVEQMALARAIQIHSLKDAILISVSAVALPAVGEELLFRGLLLPALARRYRTMTALLVSALLFGLMHRQPLAIVYASGAGLILGYVRLRTGSVLAPIAMHAAFNAVPVLLPASILPIEGFNFGGPTSYAMPLALTLGAAAICALALLKIPRLVEVDHE